MKVSAKYITKNKHLKILKYKILNHCFFNVSECHNKSILHKYGNNNSPKVGGKKMKPFPCCCDGCDNYFYLSCYTCEINLLEKDYVVIS